MPKGDLNPSIPKSACDLALQCKARNANVKEENLMALHDYLLCLDLTLPYTMETIPQGAKHFVYPGGVMT